MLKFIKHHMTSIDGVEIYPVVSLLIFFIFFTLLIVYTVKLDKVHVEEMSDFPLEDLPQTKKTLRS